MNVSLTPQMKQLIDEKLETGMYHSAAEVVREGLRLLADRDRVRSMRLEELKAEVRVGLDELERGEGIPGTQAIDELRNRLKKNHHKDS